jgi:hypothetical protein
MFVPRSATSPRTRPPKSGQTAPFEVALLEALAAAGEALTHAIVHRDMDGIVAATRDAEVLVDRLTPRSPSDRRRTEDHEPPNPMVVLLGARIGATARTNAVLLERAWATDAALLRLLAQAARGESDGAAAGAYAHQSADPDQPSGWLDRSA